ncbi:MAG TPA: metalloregulator ArsR/SmtB family transcription factor [Acidimicrobiia bacterium]
MGDVFKALADPTRQVIVDELLARDGQTLFEICVRLTSGHGLEMSRQAVSQHLDLLEEAGLIRTERRGRSKFHYLDLSPLKGAVERWLSKEKGRQK